MVKTNKSEKLKRKPYDGTTHCVTIWPVDEASEISPLVSVSDSRYGCFVLVVSFRLFQVLAHAGVFTCEDLYSRKYWKRAQYFSDQFWTRWRNEYLQNQQRSKWNKREHNLVEGDIVIMKESGLHHNEWSLGRVVEAIKSHNDGLVRKAKIASWKDGKRNIIL